MECYWWKSDKVGENLSEIWVDEYGWVKYECRIRVEYEWNMGGMGKMARVWIKNGCKVTELLRLFSNWLNLAKQD